MEPPPDDFFDPPTDFDPEPVIETEVVPDDEDYPIPGENGSLDHRRNSLLFSFGVS